MSINRPYRRACRQFKNGSYTEGGRWEYIVHPKFANSPEHYVRGFLLILKDLQELFDYVEPSDQNLNCYSYRIHSLILRACVEVEANFKAILKENGYKKPMMNIKTYQKVNITHRLSSYQIKVPHWNGDRSIRKPYAAWGSGEALAWYQAYNITKHDRHSEFGKATFDHLLDAVGGLLILLSAQFETEDFSPGDTLLSVGNFMDSDGMKSGIGGYFRVKFPDDWPDADRYDFEWQKLKEEEDPFQLIDYNKI